MQILPFRVKVPNGSIIQLPPGYDLEQIKEWTYDHFTEEHTIVLLATAYPEETEDAGEFAVEPTVSNIQALFENPGVLFREQE